MSLRLTLAAALAAWGLDAAAAEAAACRLGSEDAAFVSDAASAWMLIRRRLPLAGPDPDVVLFDAACAFDLKGAGRPYSGEVPIPGGGTVPPRRLAMASPGPERPFFAMSLPSVWGAGRPPEPPALIRAVFIHEITHTMQMAALTRRLEAVSAAHPLPDDVDDDIIQKRFGSDPAFAASVEREIALLQAAALAPDLKEARRLAAEALEAMRARRRAAYTGEDAHWGEVEDVFLTFEGAGNFAGWTWLSDPEGAGLAPAEATELMRGGRRWWSQEQGLFLFLTLERLAPDWRRRAFSETSALASDLLAWALASAPA